MAILTNTMRLQSRWFPQWVSSRPSSRQSGPHVSRLWPAPSSRLIGLGLVIAFLAATAAGCAGDRSRTEMLIAVGKDSSIVLRDFYEALILDTQDTIEIRIFIAGFSPSNIQTAQEVALLDKRLEALRYRQRLVMRMSATYETLGTAVSSSNDSPDKVKRSVGGLLEALRDIPGLGIGNEIVSLAGEVAREVTLWRQSQSISQVISSLERARDLYSRILKREATAYLTVSQQRANLTLALVDFVIVRRGEALPARLNSMVNGLDLDFKSLPEMPRPNEQEERHEQQRRLIQAFKDIARVRAERKALITLSAVESIVDAFDLLGEAQRLAVAGRVPNVAYAKAAWDRAKEEVTRMR